MGVVGLLKGRIGLWTKSNGEGRMGLVMRGDYMDSDIVIDRVVKNLRQEQHKFIILGTLRMRNFHLGSIIHCRGHSLPILPAAAVQVLSVISFDGGLFRFHEVKRRLNCAKPSL